MHESARTPGWDTHVDTSDPRGSDRGPMMFVREASQMATDERRLFVDTLSLQGVADLCPPFKVVLRIALVADITPRIRLCNTEFLTCCSE